MRRAVRVMALCATLAGCAIAPSPERLADPLADHPVLLLGEVHDNATGLQWRNALLERRVAAGWRPAIAMEQFDRERQADLDRAMASCADADCVIAAAASPQARWDWPQYRPAIALALRHRLPLIAANVSRADAARAMREGFGAVFDAALVAEYRLDAPLPRELEAAQSREIDAGHCGKLPAAMLPAMVRAQVARDIWMAAALRAHAHRGVVLLAGNGHVRRDLGVPRWLDGLAGVASIGFVEEPAPAGAFDREVALPKRERADPCAGL
ncbi:ChaN family lipoprotein [Caldimonas sp. KR1-144]|uniref:ChaN family lipoprotein n=1 Tax=Caldimonas sp. KR1-144 TaxID=3400911 RepID=UPI003C055EFB